MAHIEVEQLNVVESVVDIFTAHLTIDPTIKDIMIRTIKDGGDKQNRGTNVKASMTDWMMQREPGFVELEKEITSIINYLPEITRQEQAQAGRIAPMEIRNMWGAVYKKNDYTDVHDHWPSIWSGSFYLDIPTDYAGTLFFPELDYNIEPITGQLVIFHGTIFHGVKTIQSNGERLVVSFNYNMTLRPIY